MKNTLILGLFFTLTAFSCHKSDDTPIGGKGGNATLNIYPAHHSKSKNLINMVIYIRYNTKDAPTTYDDSAACIDNNGAPFATFTGLKKGDYYLYGRGYDTSINKNVKGGSPYTITNEASQTVPLAVSED